MFFDVSPPPSSSFESCEVRLVRLPATCERDVLRSWYYFAAVGADLNGLELIEDGLGELVGRRLAAHVGGADLAVRMLVC